MFKLEMRSDNVSIQFNILVAVVAVVVGTVILAAQISRIEFLEPKCLYPPKRLLQHVNLTDFRFKFANFLQNLTLLMRMFTTSYTRGQI